MNQRALRAVAFVLACVLGVITSNSVVRAATMVSNLGQPVEGSVYATRGQWFAAPFLTDGLSRQIESVTFKMTPGQFPEPTVSFARLRADSGSGMPGAVIHVLGNPGMPWGVRGDYTFIATSPMVLAPNTRYWVEVGSTVGGPGAPDQRAEWHYTTSTTWSGPGVMPGGTYFSSDDAASWRLTWGSRYLMFSVAATSDASNPCPYGTEHDGRCFAYRDLALSFDQAEASCATEFGGHLASVHGASEDRVVSDLVDPHAAGAITAWIGGTDAGSDGQWRWADGSAWVYTNWRLTTGEPNGSTNENCIQFWPDTNGPLSGWNDVTCAGSRGYVCSWQPGLGLALTPGHHDFGQVLVGTTKVRSFDLRNTGSLPVDVAIDVIGSTDIKPCVNGVSTCTAPPPRTLAPGEVTVLDVRFAPASTATATATLRGTSGETVVTATLAGQGTVGAQGGTIVTGRVLQATDDALLVGASLTLKQGETVIATVSQPDPNPSLVGYRFDLADLVPGPYNLVASAPNYYSSSVELALSSGNFQRDFRLVDGSTLPRVVLRSKYEGEVTHASHVRHQVPYTATIDWANVQPRGLRIERTGPGGTIEQQWSANCDGVAVACPATWTKTIDMFDVPIGHKLRASVDYLTTTDQIATVAGDPATVRVVEPCIPIPALSDWKVVDKTSTFSYVPVGPAVTWSPLQGATLRLPSAAWLLAGSGFDFESEGGDSDKALTFDFDRNGSWEAEFEWTKDLCAKENTGYPKLCAKGNTSDHPDKDFWKDYKKWSSGGGAKPKMAFANKSINVLFSAGMTGRWYPTCELDSASARLGLQLEWELTRYWIMGWVPMYLKNDFGVELTGGGKMTQLNPIRGSVDISLGLEDTLRVGAGIDKALTVYGQGRFDVEFTMELLPDFAARSAELSGDASFWLRVWRWKKQLAGIGVECSWEAGHDWFCNRTKDLDGASSEWATIPRLYLGDPEYALFRGGRQPSKTVGSVGAVLPVPIQENVFEASAPAIASAGGYLYLSWLWDDPKRGPADSTRAVFSQWDGAGWTEPIFVDHDVDKDGSPFDDLTGDYAPTLLAFADGSALAAWQDGVQPHVYDCVAPASVAGEPDEFVGSCQPGTCSDNGAVPCLIDDDCRVGTCVGTGCAEGTQCQGPAIDTVARNFDLSVARFDPIEQSWQVARRFGLDDRIDGSPLLAAASQADALLLWVSNPTWDSSTQGDFRGSAVHPNTLSYTDWDGAAWSAPSQVPCLEPESDPEFCLDPASGLLLPDLMLRSKMLRSAALYDGETLSVVLSLCPDADGDGACEAADNCPGLFNPYQEDVDLDGVGSACELGPEEQPSAVPGETDFELHVSGDSELYLLTRTTSGGWSPLMRLTDDDVPDENPRLAFDLDGEIVMVWLHGGKLISSAGLSLDAVDRALASPPIWDQDYSTNMADFSLAVGPSGKLVLIWPDSERFATAEGLTKGGTDLRALFFDETRNKWGSPRRLTGDEETEQSVAVAFDGSSRLVAVYDRTESSTEIKTLLMPSGKTMKTVEQVPLSVALYMATLELGDDLALVPDSIFADPAIAVPGDDVVVTVEVLNLGESAVGGETEDDDHPRPLVELFVGDPGAPGAIPIASRTLDDLLGPSQSTAVSLQVDLPLDVPSGELVARVAFNPGDFRIDRDPTNNQASVAVARPDLEVFTAGWDRIQPGRFSIDARILNKGADLETGYTVRFSTGSVAGAELGAFTFTGLGSYETRGISLEHDAASDPGYTGSLVIFVAIEVDEAGGEINTSNNVRRQIILEDDAPPTIDLSGVVVAECAGPLTAVDLTLPTVDDAYCGALVELSGDAPTLFPFGRSAVNWTATDCNGFTGGASQTVDVVDTRGPAVEAHDATVECTSSAGTPFAPEATALDACCGDQLSLAHDAPAGFPPGSTQVTWSATDCHDRMTVDSGEVTVVDTTPPELSVPAPAVFECSTHGGAQPIDLEFGAWIATAQAQDACGAALVSNDLPPLVPPGDVAVTFTARDDAGLTTSAQSSAAVVDTLAPAVSAAFRPVPGPRRIHNNIAAEFSVEDLCDAAPASMAVMDFGCGRARVTHGQTFTYRYYASDCKFRTVNGSLEIVAPWVELRVVGTDASGNSATAVTRMGRQEKPAMREASRGGMNTFGTKR